MIRILLASFSVVNAMANPPQKKRNGVVIGNLVLKNGETPKPVYNRIKQKPTKPNPPRRPSVKKGMRGR